MQHPDLGLLHDAALRCHWHCAQAVNVGQKKVHCMKCFLMLIWNRIMAATGACFQSLDRFISNLQQCVTVFFSASKHAHEGMSLLQMLHDGRQSICAISNAVGRCRPAADAQLPGAGLQSRLSKLGTPSTLLSASHCSLPCHTTFV